MERRGIHHRKYIDKFLNNVGICEETVGKHIFGQCRLQKVYGQNKQMMIPVLYVASSIICFSNGSPPKASLHKANKHTKSPTIKVVAKPDAAPLT